MEVISQVRYAVLWHRFIPLRQSIGQKDFWFEQLSFVGNGVISLKMALLVVVKEDKVIIGNNFVKEVVELNCECTRARDGEGNDGCYSRDQFHLVFQIMIPH